MKKFLAVLITVMCLGLCLTSCDIGLRSKEATDDEYFEYYLTATGYEVGAKEGVELPENIILPKTHEGKAVIGVKANGFANQENLRSVVIPSTYLFVEEKAFYYCERLSSVVFMDTENYDGLTIGTLAFGNCKSLSYLYFSDAVQVLQDRAFFNCESLTKVRLDCVKDISASAFLGCERLTNLWGTIDKPMMPSFEIKEISNEQQDGAGKPTKTDK